MTLTHLVPTLLHLVVLLQTGGKPLHMCEPHFKKSTDSSHEFPPGKTVLNFATDFQINVTGECSLLVL